VSTEEQPNLEDDFKIVRAKSKTTKNKAKRKVAKKVGVSKGETPKVVAPKVEISKPKPSAKLEEQIALKRAEQTDKDITDNTVDISILSDGAAFSNMGILDSLAKDIVWDIGPIEEEPIEAHKIEPPEEPLLVVNNINNDNIGRDGTFSLGLPRDSVGRTTFKHGGMIHNQE